MERLVEYCIRYWRADNSTFYPLAGKIGYSPVLHHNPHMHVACLFFRMLVYFVHSFGAGEGNCCNSRFKHVGTTGFRTVSYDFFYSNVTVLIKNLARDFK